MESSDSKTDNQEEDQEIEMEDPESEELIVDNDDDEDDDEVEEIEEDNEEENNNQIEDDIEVEFDENDWVEFEPEDGFGQDDEEIQEIEEENENDNGMENNTADNNTENNVADANNLADTEQINENDPIAGDERRNKKDVTALDVLKGRDIQGMVWWGNTTRESFKLLRKLEYLHKNKEGTNYVETPEITAHMEKDKIQVEYGKQFYNFNYNARVVRTSATHIQLRNLLWAYSKHDIYFTYNNCMQHYNPESGEVTDLLDLSGKAKAPFSVIPSSLPADFLQYRKVVICTMCVKSGYYIAGGLQGEVVILDLERGNLLYNDRITFDQNSITNAIDIGTQNGDVRVVCSNNDSVIRTFHLPTMRVISRFNLNYCVNYSALSPDEKLLCVVGDHQDGLLMDSSSGQVLSSLKGHHEYGFAAAWHPSGRLLATGHQDRTTRLWDIRFPSTCYGLLKAHQASVRSIRFTPDGKYMAMAESADFVQVFDVDSNFSNAQTIDLLGEISGISFSPCGEFLYIGNADRTYGGIMEYTRNRYDQFQIL